MISAFGIAENVASPLIYTEEARFKEDRHWAAVAPLPSGERGRGCPSFHSGCFAKGPTPPHPARPQIAGARSTRSGPAGSIALSGRGCDEGSSSAIAGATALFTSHP